MYKIKAKLSKIIWNIWYLATFSGINRNYNRFVVMHETLTLVITIPYTSIWQGEFEAQCTVFAKICLKIIESFYLLVTTGPQASEMNRTIY